MRVTTYVSLLNKKRLSQNNLHTPALSGTLCTMMVSSPTSVLTTMMFWWPRWDHHFSSCRCVTGTIIEGFCFGPLSAHLRWGVGGYGCLSFHFGAILTKVLQGCTSPSGRAEIQKSRVFQFQFFTCNEKVALLVSSILRNNGVILFARKDSHGKQMSLWSQCPLGHGR